MCAPVSCTGRAGAVWPAAAAMTRPSAWRAGRCEAQLEQALIDDHRRTRQGMWRIAVIFVTAAAILVAVDVVLVDRPAGWVLAPPTVWRLCSA